MASQLADLPALQPSHPCFDCAVREFAVCGVLEAAARQLQELEGVDACPEGGAALAGLAELVRRGLVDPAERIVVFNTGAGWLYRS